VPRWPEEQEGVKRILRGYLGKKRNRRSSQQLKKIRWRNYSGTGGGEPPKKRKGGRGVKDKPVFSHPEEGERRM